MYTAAEQKQHYVHDKCTLSFSTLLCTMSYNLCRDDGLCSDSCLCLFTRTHCESKIKNYLRWLFGTSCFTTAVIKSVNVPEELSFNTSYFRCWCWRSTPFVVDTKASMRWFLQYRTQRCNKIQFAEVQGHVQ